MFDIKKFGGYLSCLRKNADMTQMELADRLNLTRQAISRYEHGDSFPDVSILVTIAEIFHVTLDELINSGTPTRGESLILESMAKGKEPAAPQHIEDVLSLAPYLKPSVLSNLSSGLAKQGIDISSAVSLAEYLNDSSTVAMLENTRFEEVTPQLLEKLMPFLDYSSKYTILQKILDGEMDWRLLRLVGLYMDDLVTLIEAAVVEGVLPWKALKMLRGTDTQGMEHSS